MKDPSVRRTSGLLLVAFLCLFPGAGPTAAQEEAASPSFELGSALPVDPQLRKGRFDNGLEYFIRVNTEPANRAQLRLVVNAGSILEDEDQLGLAHFVEHMAFNGTKNFEKQALVDYLESIGSRFGADTNAYTSFDETVYQLQVPTDDEQILATAFQILEEWAHLVSFDGEEIEKERGVVIEEWRTGRGAAGRMRDQQFPVLFKDSLYAERLAIGSKEILESFDHDTLRRYYRDWYRPDLMAVIAVGDFDPDVIESLIESHFAHLPPAGEDARLRFEAEVPDHDETLVSIVSDPELSGTAVSVAFKRDPAPEGTVGDYRRSLVESIFYSMFNGRLNERSQEADPPFLGASAAGGAFVRGKDINMLSAGVIEGGLDRGMIALLTEAERARRHGFLAAEMERQKVSLLRFYERAYTERDKTSSRVHAAEYIRAFLEGEPTPGITYERDLANHVVPGIRLEEVNDIAESFLAQKNRVILVSAPGEADEKVTDRESLLAAFEDASASDVEPYFDLVADGPLLADLPAAGEIVDRLSIEQLGLEQWTLSNGILVVLRPSDFKNDEVRFTAFSPGGHSLVEDEDHVAAMTATAIIGQGGIGELGLIELRKALAGKVVGVSPTIGELTEGISGGGSPQDLETLFQLVHLYLTAPRKDEDAFRSYKVRMEGMVENRDKRPETAYRDRLQAILTQDHFRYRPFTAELLEELDLERSFAVYLDRFRDLGDFTFVFIGNFELDRMEDLVTTYLGSLPSSGREESFRDVGLERPEGVIEETIYSGLEEKARVDLIFGGPFTWTRQNRYLLGSMASALRIGLREVLREDMGGVYGVSVNASSSRLPKPEYSVRIGFECAPESVDQLKAAVFAKIAEFQQSVIDDEVLAKVTETQRRSRETQMTQNGFWLSQLRFAYYHDEDPRNLLRLEELIESLDSEGIRAAARQYLNDQQYVQMTLLPESHRPQTAAAN